MSAPLEDARHLTYHYERIRQEVEAQVFINLIWSVRRLMTHILIMIMCHLPGG